MRRTRKFLSLVAIGSLTAMPLLAAGCADQPSTPTAKPPGTPAPSTVEAKKPAPIDTVDLKKPKPEHAAPAKPSPGAKSSAEGAPEAGSTTGAGVKPPVK